MAAPRHAMSRPAAAWTCIPASCWRLSLASVEWGPGPGGRGSSRQLLESVESNLGSEECLARYHMNKLIRPYLRVPQTPGNSSAAKARRATKIGTRDQGNMWDRNMKIGGWSEAEAQAQAQAQAEKQRRAEAETDESADCAPSAAVVRPQQAPNGPSNTNLQQGKGGMHYAVGHSCSVQCYRADDDDSCVR